MQPEISKLDPKLIEKAKVFCRQSQFVSSSALQRHFKLSYYQATELAQFLIDEKFCEKHYTVQHGYPVIFKK